MALSRFLQPHEGAADIFGSERSFSLAVGSRFDLDAADPKGYYIDFRIKAGEPQWPPAWIEPADRQLHVMTVQWALGAYERYLHGEGDEWLQAALDAGRYLVSIQATEGAHDGAWLQWFPMPHTYVLPVPWASGITQGEGISLLARLHHATGDEEFAAAALRAMRPLRTRVEDGGLLTTLEGRPSFEEYPSTPASHVLNGEIFAIWGIRDAARCLGDHEAAGLIDSAVAGLAANLHRYDTGRWSRYDLFPYPFPNLATGSYHALHISQLSVLEQMSDEPELGRVRQRFADYRERGSNRTDAFARKVAFRVVVPRNASLAQRNPSMAWQRRRQSQTSSLALCYHALSEDWPAALAVRPAEFEDQIARLLDRGYAPSTFTDLVTSESTEKRVAITFDDGFRSVATQALPILDRLGAFATLFIPTALAPGDAPLQWPGIDQWLGTPHEHELAPLSAAELQTLLDAGWEIGAHSRTHPRLPGLGDDELAAELGGSRRECEQLIGAPCRSVAYPYGATDARVERAAAKAGFAAGATLPAGRLQASRYAWPRIGIYRADTARRFGLKVGRGTMALRRTPLWNLRGASTNRSGS
jgi:peptidoglycan/xylan/chitin deacetylase (PgdA/CDA1 family)